MSDQYGPHSNGNIVGDGNGVRPYEPPAEQTASNALAPLLYTQAQVDVLVRAEMERCLRHAEREKVDADATGDEGDRAYNEACDHIAAAIRSGK